MDIHHSLGSKKLQEEFDQKVTYLFNRITDVNKRVIKLNKSLN